MPPVQDIWPGLSGASSRNFGRIGAQLGTEDPNVFLQQSVEYFSIKQYCSGTTASAQEITFFDEGELADVCNLPKPFAVSTERPFWMTGVYVAVYDGTRSTNALAVVAEQSFDPDAASSLSQADVYALAALKANIINFGTMSLRINDTPVFPDKRIRRLGAGGGPRLDMVATDTATTKTRTAMSLVNGEPASFNVYSFRNWFPVLPDQRISCKIRWPFTQTGTANTGVLIEVGLVGEGLISRAG